ncbi:MAG: hypothetical protein H6815_05835 [Phycisphaeraceae bacterium]|nr:hypothetical protein [Phycisphaerales bacterium]MCB9859959.1 hypothetical protein [Phycisphaeraceae bacterium]
MSHDPYANIGIGPRQDTVRRNAQPVGVHHAQPQSMQDAIAARSLFWLNVMREILTSLASESLRRPQLEASDLLQAAGDVESVEYEDEDNMFDGRLAVLTHAGERIPIADVQPIMTAGPNTTGDERELSMTVECTVFQITTPTGEIFTLPLEEMRGFHALTPQLMDRIKQSARGQEIGVSSDGAEPFGFAAFTSLAKNATVRQPGKSGEVPEHEDSRSGEKK